MAAVKYIFAFLLVLILAASNAYSAKLAEGEPPPSFTLIDENGKQVDFYDLLDKPAVIYFTHNACHYCTQIIAMLKPIDYPTLE